MAKPNPVAPKTTTAAKFGPGILRGEKCGLAVVQDIVRYRADLGTALAVLEPLYRRAASKSDRQRTVRFVTADLVNRQALAEFAVRDVGGIPEWIAARLNGQGDAFALRTSFVALAEDAIVGVVLTVPRQDVLVFENKTVDVRHRGGWINLALMYLSAAAADRLGVQVVEFENDTRN